MPATTIAALTGSWQLALSAPGGTLTATVPCTWAVTIDGAAPTISGSGHVLQSQVDRDFRLAEGERIYVRRNAGATAGTLVTTGAAA